jgi:hypothetical protein
MTLFAEATGVGQESRRAKRAGIPQGFGMPLGFREVALDSFGSLFPSLRRGTRSRNSG